MYRHFEGNWHCSHDAQSESETQVNRALPRTCVTEEKQTSCESVVKYTKMIRSLRWHKVPHRAHGNQLTQTNWGTHRRRTQAKTPIIDIVQVGMTQKRYRHTTVWWREGDMYISQPPTSEHTWQGLSNGERNACPNKNKSR